MEPDRQQDLFLLSVLASSRRASEPFCQAARQGLFLISVLDPSEGRVAKLIRPRVVVGCFLS
jgi:hypothetical protein